MSWVNRISNLFRRNQVDEELEEELQFHLDARTRDNLSAGMNAEAAQHDARRRFGNVILAKERAHEMNIVVSIETFGRDLRYALRGLRKSPGFTVIAILTLALGIGANTAVFSVVDAALLRPLPYRNADRLVMIAQRLAKEPAPIFDTYREFEEWNRISNSFETMAAATWAARLQTILSWHGEKTKIMAVPVSVNFLSMLGVSAAQGRTFAPKDRTSACTVVLAYPFWQKQLGGTQEWIGKSLTLDDRACTIVGVMPKDFSLYPKRTELWTLITPGSQFVQKPWDMPMIAFGLLNPGVSRSAAQAELAGIQSRIITENPSWAAMKLEPALEDLQSEFTLLTGRNLRRSLFILFAVVGFVLLIACVNVANLLVGRATVRQKELGVRSALGAGRARLIRQLLTESAVLSLLGAGLGVFLAILCVRFIATEEAMQLPPGNPISVNWEALVFTFILAILTGVLFGVVPAWKASRLDLNEVLKQSQPTASRVATSHRTSRNLVVAEMALSLIVLVAAGLLIQSLIRLTTAPLGYERDGLLTADLRLPASSYPKPEDSMRFWDRLGLKLASLPGVQGVAFASSLALARGTERVTIAGAGSPSRVVTALQSEPVSGGYFRVVGIPLLQGREFSDVDRFNSMPVAIVNELSRGSTFQRVRRLGNGSSAVGLIRKSPGSRLLALPETFHAPHFSRGTPRVPPSIGPCGRLPKAP